MSLMHGTNMKMEEGVCEWAFQCQPCLECVTSQPRQQRVSLSHVIHCLTVGAASSQEFLSF